MAAGDGIAAFDPNVWITQTRTQLLTAAGLKPGDLERAVARNRKLLDAKKVKHFADKGIVTDERTVEDHEAQLRAIELLYDLAGVKAPKAQAASQAVGVEVVIDPGTGQVIVRAASGSGHAK